MGWLEIVGIVLACLNLVCVGGNLWVVRTYHKKVKRLNECLAKLQGGWEWVL